MTVWSTDTPNCAPTGWLGSSAAAGLCHPTASGSMRGILWRQELEARRDAARVRNEKRRVLQGTVKVVVVNLADWHAQNVGSRAG